MTRQVVILIRGHPGVGKTTLAEALAKSMNFFLLSKDDVRDVAVRWDAITNEQIRNAHPDTSLRIDTNDMTYEVCFSIGLTQLRIGAPGVVFESPLGRVTLGERAVTLFKKVQAFVVLVDCYAERSVWEARLATRRPGSHRPRDAEKILSHYGGEIDYAIDVDAHVRVDCARPTEQSVREVERVISQLVEEEKLA